MRSNTHPVEVWKAQKAKEATHTLGRSEPPLSPPLPEGGFVCEHESQRLHFNLYSSRAPSRLIQLAPMLKGMSQNFPGSFTADAGCHPHVSSKDIFKHIKGLGGRFKGTAWCVAVSLKGLL